MEDNKTLIENIKINLFKKDKKTLNAAVIRRDVFKNSELANKIKEKTNFLDFKKPTFGERIYCILNNIHELQTCKNCNSIRKYVSTIQGYRNCKNNKCVRIGKNWKSSSETKKKNWKFVIANFIEDYKNKNYKNVDIKNIIDYIRNETSKNKNNKYINHKKIKSNSNELFSIIDYTKNLIPLDEKDFKMNQRFYIIFNDIKTIPTCSCGNPLKFINFFKGYQQECKRSCKNKQRIEKIKKDVFEKQKMVILTDENVLKNNIFNIKCLSCNTTHSRELTNKRWSNIYCPECFKDPNISKEEKSVLNYIKENYTGEIIENYKIENLELDIFLPEVKLGIEYNGILWHTFGTKFPQNYEKENNQKYKHYNKTKKCFDMGIKLLHINSDEWLDSNKKEIWKSILLNNLNKSKKIYARKCELVENVKYVESRNFLDENHLQGNVNSPIRIGLYYENELICLMTFSKPRFSKNYEYELIRFCNKKNHQVIGGASKIFKFFVEKYRPKNVISYADLRYSDGKLYKNLKFEFLKFSGIDYFYINPSNMQKINRIHAQKHKLKKFLRKFDENLSEFENMCSNNYRRFWNCGNYLFLFKNDMP